MPPKHQSNSYSRFIQTAHAAHAPAATARYVYAQGRLPPVQPPPPQVRMTASAIDEVQAIVAGDIWANVVAQDYSAPSSALPSPVPSPPISPSYAHRSRPASFHANMLNPYMVEGLSTSPVIVPLVSSANSSFVLPPQAPPPPPPITLSTYATIMNALQQTRNNK